MKTCEYQKHVFFVPYSCKKIKHKTNIMAFLNQTKTVAIIGIVLILMVGVLIWINKDSLFSKKDSKKEESKVEDKEEIEETEEK